MTIAPNVEAHRRAAARYVLGRRVRSVVTTVSAAAIMGVAVGLFVKATILMPNAKNVTEPQLVQAQVGFLVIPAFALWFLGMLLAARSWTRTPSRTVVMLVALLPVVALLLAAAPTLANVCGREGGVCG